MLVLHGGLFSKDETTLNDVRKIQRHQAFLPPASSRPLLLRSLARSPSFSPSLPSPILSCIATVSWCLHILGAVLLLGRNAVQGWCGGARSGAAVLRCAPALWLSPPVASCAGALQSGVRGRSRARFPCAGYETAPALSSDSSLGSGCLSCRRTAVWGQAAPRTRRACGRGTPGPLTDVGPTGSLERKRCWVSAGLVWSCRVDGGLCRWLDEGSR